MPKIKCPCKGCDHREIGCHSVCDGYKAFRAELDERNDYIHEEYIKKFWKTELRIPRQRESSTIKTRKIIDAKY